ncbi:unnamed protein product [Prunus armeniaca]
MVTKESLIHILKEYFKKSYDALDDDAKEVFLDIACFFKGANKDVVLQIVPQNCIVLLDKAMITIEWDDRILMHDLLANLGKNIVHKESPNDPGKRSRLWFYEDVKLVLTENTGTRNIKGIIVKLPESAEINLNPECFRNMVNLEIFINRNASLCGHINYLPNALRLIDWDRCQLQSLPPNFQGNRLVEFNMPCSHIRQLEGFKVDGSVGFLDKLVQLDLGGCLNLTRFATRLRLKSLEELDLRDCKMLVSFPEIEVQMESLRHLNISGSGVRELPSSIAYLTGLRELYLSGCFNLTRFATLGLKSFEELDLSDCERLESFPEIEVEMESLETLGISGSGVRELPSSIAHLTGLEVLQPDYCENLTITVNSQVSSSNSELQLLPNLIDFRLRGCNL